MQTSRLNLPAKKSQIYTLRVATRVKNNTSISDINVWRVNDQPTFSIIWIQGRIVNVVDRTFEVDDSTGRAKVIENVPALTPDLKTGKYVMVVGELLDNRPTVRPLKVQDLSQDEQAVLVWPLEIQDADNFLAQHECKEEPL